MQEAFRKEIVKQLDKCIKEMESLLAIEGSISDLTSLPPNLARSTQEQIGYFTGCRNILDQKD